VSVATSRETAHAADQDQEAVEEMIDAEGRPALDPTLGAHPAVAGETAKEAILPSAITETIAIANGKGIEETEGTRAGLPRLARAEAALAASARAATGPVPPQGPSLDPSPAAADPSPLLGSPSSDLQRRRMVSPPSLLLVSPN
jgi:hypothetical protein